MNARRTGKERMRVAMIAHSLSLYVMCMCLIPSLSPGKAILGIDAWKTRVQFQLVSLAKYIRTTSGAGYPLCDRETMGNIWVKINIFPTKFPLIIFNLPTSYLFNNFYIYCTHFPNRLPIFCLYLHVFPSISQLQYQHFLFMPMFCQHNIFTTPHFK